MTANQTFHLRAVERAEQVRPFPDSMPAYVTVALVGTCGHRLHVMQQAHFDAFGDRAMSKRYRCFYCPKEG